MSRILKQLTITFALLATLVSAFAFTASPAAAEEMIAVTGSVEGGTFSGVIIDPVYEAREYSMGITAVLQGVAVIDGVETAVEFEFVAEVFVTQMDCQTLIYTVSPIYSETLDAEITLDPIAVERQDPGLIGGLLGGGAFCLIDGLLDGDDPDNDAIADFLNELVGN